MVGGGGGEESGGRVEQGQPKVEESSSETTRATACSLGRHYKALITYNIFIILCIIYTGTITSLLYNIC